MGRAGSDRHEAKNVGDLTLRGVTRGETPLFAGPQQRRDHQRGDRQVPGFHRA